MIERDGYLHNEHGINIEELYQYIIEHKTIKGYPGATFNADGKKAL